MNWTKRYEELCQTLNMPDAIETLVCEVRNDVSWLEKLMEENLISHPVETVVETAIIKEIQLSQIAILLGMDATDLARFLAGKIQIDEIIAQKLEFLFGVDAEFWLNRQGKYNKKIFELLNKQHDI